MRKGKREIRVEDRRERENELDERKRYRVVHDKRGEFSGKERRGKGRKDKDKRGNIKVKEVDKRTGFRRGNEIK